MPPKLAKAELADKHLFACRDALENIAVALLAEEPVDLKDAKVLEAAGCWYRRNLVAKS